MTAAPRHEPAKKPPLTTQMMWERAYQDYSDAETRLGVALRLKDETLTELARARATQEAGSQNEHEIDRLRAKLKERDAVVADRDRTMRLRTAMCNAIDFMITNKNDVQAVLARGKG